ncbi:hypothetical protein Leryth_020740 [Lithospermum erythrorhizon]|nr:hypothetical protein Leryth_020740 [Lithospermum erythrorhizon]
MNRGHVLQSSSPYVQHMIGVGSPNLWSINNMRPSSQPTSSSFLAPPPPLPPNIFPQFLMPPPPPSSTQSPPLPSSWNDTQELPESWSQLLLGGLVGEEEKSSSLSNMQIAKKLENWEEHLLQQTQTSGVDVKQENSINYGNMYATTHHGNNAEMFQTSSVKPSWSQMIPVSSPNSCVTTISSTTNMLDFSSKNDARHPPPSHSSECNSTGTGGVVKKARVQPTSSNQSTFKVRKEKLGDRITALHQIVSPFG